MSTYRLEETLDIFISATFGEEAYMVRMYRIQDETTAYFIRDIDLRKDKLIIHGTEIKESMWKKLHNSLRLRLKDGLIFVNANGECYVVLVRSGSNLWYRTIENVIFDWSLFGVVVPNSGYEVLRRQLLQKDQELAAMNSLQKAWDASKQENEELKKQLSACTKEQLDKEIELQKVRSQLCVKKFKFESLKEEVEELQEHVSASKMKDYKNMELEHQMVVTFHQQLSSTMSELKSTKDMWELSKEQLLISKKEIEDMKVKIQSMHDQVSSVLFELQSTKIELEASNKKVVELEKQNEFSSSSLELTKTRLESPYKKITELDEQVSSCKKVQEQLSLIMNELQGIKDLSDFTAEKVVELEDQRSDKSYVIKAIEIVDDKSKLNNNNVE